MERTTITFDRHQVQEAARILGTRGLSATVREALDAVIRRDAASRIRTRMTGPAGLTLRDPEFERKTWR